MSKLLDNGLSRRDALKLLGAAAGASVLANLPSRWSTPQLTAGVLPAHAATSCTGYGLVFETSGAPLSALTLDLAAGSPPPDGSAGNGNSRTWTWDETHCDCAVFRLVVDAPIDWSISNSGGAGPSGSLGAGGTLYVASNLATGAIVASEDGAEFVEGLNRIGCGTLG